MATHAALGRIDDLHADIAGQNVEVDAAIRLAADGPHQLADDDAVVGVAAHPPFPLRLIALLGEPGFGLLAEELVGLRRRGQGGLIGQIAELPRGLEHDLETLNAGRDCPLGRFINGLLAVRAVLVRDGLVLVAKMPHRLADGEVQPLEFEPPQNRQVQSSRFEVRSRFRRGVVPS